jgi:5-methylcytosine-specific restriction endonuclease McrA
MPGILLPDAVEASVNCQICRNKVVTDQDRTKRAAEWQAQAREREQQRIQENERWRAWYQQYLQTPEWRARRQAVLERARGLCEGCRQRPAGKVRHLTYAHAGYELLWELVAVCESCNEACSSTVS